MSRKAQEALKFANSCLDDVTEAIHPLERITAQAAPALLHSLDQARRSIGEAESIEPRTTIRGVTNGEEREIDIPTLKAAVLLYQGLIRVYGLGQNKAAARLMEESLRHVSNFPNAHFALGCVYADMGKTSEARKHLRIAIDLDPSNEEYQAIADTVSGRIAFSKDALRDRMPILGKMLVNVIFLLPYLVMLSQAPSSTDVSVWPVVGLLIWGFIGFRWLLEAFYAVTGLVIFTSITGWGKMYLVGSLVVGSFGVIVIPILLVIQFVQLWRPINS